MTVTVLSRAIAFLQAGDALSARSVLLEARLDDARKDFLLGAAAHALGEIPQAIRHFTDALKRDPAHAQAACALGSLYAGLGHRVEAVALFRQTLARVDDSQLRFNLAVVLADLGQPEEALAQYRHLLAQDPRHYGARHNRAGLHAAARRFSEAAADYRVLVQEHPAETLPWHNLGELELALGHYEEAARLLAEVLRREPGNGKARLSLAVAEAAAGEITESRASFAALKTVAPALWEEALGRLNHLRGRDDAPDPRLLFLARGQEHLAACHWRYWERFAEVFHDVARAPGEGDALMLAFPSLLAPLTAAEQLGLMRHIAGQVARRAPSLPPVPPSPAPSRLRIGYAAPQWGHHVTGLLFRDLVAAHDPATTEIILIALRAPDDSANLRALRSRPGLRFVDVSGLDDEASARAIRDLELDVLIDLGVYNDDNRPEVFAARPAPVQAGWQAAPYSSGAPWLDYVIADAIVRPGDGWCSEAEVLMPDSYFCFSHAATPPVAPARAALGLPEQKFVFACLNHPARITPGLFRRWMHLLGQAPESVLWLLVNDSAGILNLKREAEWAGIDPRRLLFAPRVAPEAHLARLAAADLFLDTELCNGHTTLAECLWAGTPAVSQRGRTFASRVGVSLLHSVGLPELAVDSADAYDALALRLYREPAQLAALRQRLAGNRLTASCMDVAGQARHLEKAYRHMRERFAQGLPPAAFAVADLP